MIFKRKQGFITTDINPSFLRFETGDGFRCIEETNYEGLSESDRMSRYAIKILFWRHLAVVKRKDVDQ